MKAGFLQFNPIFGRKKTNFIKVAEMLKDVTCDLIVLPELFNTGYTFNDREELIALAESAEWGETRDFVQAQAREKNCLIAYGFAERENHMFYNSCSLMGPTGPVGLYRKVHLFCREKEFFAPGNTGFQVFEYGGVKYGLMICFDWIYPEVARTLALKGAQVILHPSNLVLPYCPDAMVTRAIENRVFIITTNRVGTEERNGQANRFIGRSQVVSPKAEVLVRVETEECVRIVEIEPTLALNKDVTPYNNIFTDRRQDLYFK
jgi:predicted amidohydrolase